MKRICLISILSVFVVVSLSCMCRVRNECERKRLSFAKSLEKAGIPDQMEIDDQAQIENAKMVSEGSQFGVQYFNEFAEEQMQENYADK